MTQGARILVVDDEPQIRRSLQVNLESKGYAVETAETGEEAIGAFHNRHPDVIILDLIMPGTAAWKSYAVFENLPLCRSSSCRRLEMNAARSRHSRQERTTT